MEIVARHFNCLLVKCERMKTKLYFLFFSTKQWVEQWNRKKNYWQRMIQNHLKRETVYWIENFLNFTHFFGSHFLLYTDHSYEFSLKTISRNIWCPHSMRSKIILEKSITSYFLSIWPKNILEFRWYNMILIFLLFSCELIYICWLLNF